MVCLYFACCVLGGVGVFCFVVVWCGLLLLCVRCHAMFSVGLWLGLCWVVLCLWCAFACVVLCGLCWCYVGSIGVLCCDVVLIALNCVGALWCVVVCCFVVI